MILVQRAFVKMIKKWKCLKCGTINQSDSKKTHCMDYCKCGQSAVDLEEHYGRVMGNIEWVK